MYKECIVEGAHKIVSVTKIQEGSQHCELSHVPGPIPNPDTGLYGITSNSQSVWVQNRCKVTVNVCYESKFL